MDKIPGTLAGFPRDAEIKKTSLKIKEGLIPLLLMSYTDFVKPIWVIMVSYGSNSMVCLP